jgi:thioredoxin-like negative regulator of GroEL
MSKKILRFTASWCGPCKSLAQNLEIADLGLPIEVIDIDVHDDIANDYGIRSVPTLVMIQENIEVKRLIGSKPVNQLKEWAND